ncbi:MAG: SDR family oxidoreductase [Flavobacteriaceae bacterium]
MERLNGKTIWVTGASSGIGEALALALDKKGCRLILSARNEDRLKAVKARCTPGNVHIVPLDLEQYASFPELAAQVFSTYGPVDILINNAGISQRSLIVDTELSVYERMMHVNYLGTVALTKAVLPHFVARQKGHFVTVTSLMGKFGSPYRSGYCGAKHALHGFFDVLRMEHEGSGIDVTLVCPGFVQTAIAKNALTADGSPQGTEDVATKNGLPVSTFAHKMIRAMERKKFEVYIGQREVAGIYLKRFFPRILHKVVLRSRVT